MMCGEKDKRKKHKAGRREASGCRLPEEIICEILVRVPTMESLLRCRVVCKLWNSLVMTSAFILTHLKSRLSVLSNNKDDLLVSYSSRNIECRSPYQFFFLDSDNIDHEYTKCRRRVIPPRDDIEELVSSVKQLDKSYVSWYPQGTCNGLICVILHSNRDYKTRQRVSIPILWNPCVRKLLILPSPSFSPRYAYDEYAVLSYVFGYDSLTNDLKLVQIVGPRPQEEDGHTPRTFHVFSLLSGSWKNLDPPRDFRPCILDLKSLVFNGALHWICGQVIITFNLSTELFGEMEIAEALIKDSPCYKLNYRGLFGLLSSRKARSERSVFDVWAMKEYGVAESWTKMLTFRIPDSFGYCPHQPKYFRKSTGQVIVGSFSGVISTDPDQGDQVKVIVNDRLDVRYLLDPFVETLVLLDRSDAFSY